jgi:hypothetical protein
MGTLRYSVDPLVFPGITGGQDVISLRLGADRREPAIGGD